MSRRTRRPTCLPLLRSIKLCSSRNTNRVNVVEVGTKDCRSYLQLCLIVEVFGLPPFRSPVELINTST